MKKFDIRVFMAGVRHEAGEKHGPAVTCSQVLQLLLQTDSESFMRMAYRLFFNREPDASGMTAYLPRARSMAGRLKLLAIFWLAPERKFLPTWQRLMLEKGSWLLQFKWLK